MKSIGSRGHPQKAFMAVLDTARTAVAGSGAADCSDRAAPVLRRLGDRERPPAGLSGGSDIEHGIIAD